jgi:hypothetical protein
LNTSVEHEHHQVDEEGRVVPDDVVSLAAHVHKLLEVAGGLISPINDVSHVRCEDKRNTIPIDGSKGLKVVEKTTKIDVKQTASSGNEYVVVVSVAHT